MEQPQQMSPFVLTEENWREFAKQRYIPLPGEDIVEHVCIELVQGEETFRFGTFENFSLIIGKPKSRKSTLIALFISELLKENPDEAIKI